jgi:hypothetical protein
MQYQALMKHSDREKRSSAPKPEGRQRQPVNLPDKGPIKAFDCHKYIFLRNCTPPIRLCALPTTVADMADVGVASTFPRLCSVQ